MAVICSHEKEDAHSQGIVDGSHDFPLRCCSRAQLLKPGPGDDAATRSYCLDVVPVLSESSIPETLARPYGSSQDQDFCSISGLSEQRSINPHSSLDLALLGFLEVPTYPFGSQMCSDHQNCGNNIDSKLESTDKNMSFGVDIEFTEECLDVPKITVENFKPMTTEGVLYHLQTALLRKSSNLQVGGKMLQFLADRSWMFLKCTSRAAKTALPLHSSTDKCTNERGLDATNNKFIRYKRSASFNSRKIVLFSSILSSMGTMVLIYLTLRVKQISDGLVHVQ